MSSPQRLLVLLVLTVPSLLADTLVQSDPGVGLDLPDYSGETGEYERPERTVLHHRPYPPPPPPQYPGYHAPAPPPLYSHRPSHNCSVEDELLTAEICTPTYTTSCGPVSVRGTKLAEREECLDITRTVCTAATTQQEVQICLVEYQPAVKQAEAITVEVKFAKECDKQMVTVCQPQPAYSAGTYHTVQHCKEVSLLSSERSKLTLSDSDRPGDLLQRPQTGGQEGQGGHHPARAHGEMPDQAGHHPHRQLPGRHGEVLREAAQRRGGRGGGGGLRPSGGQTKV